MGRPARETPDVFSAIGHWKRRRIIELVAVAGSLSVGAIVSHFSESRQAISKHIGVLEEVEVLLAETVGNERHYTVDFSALQEVQAWVALFDEHWDAKLTALKSYLEKE